MGCNWFLGYSENYFLFQIFCNRLSTKLAIVNWIKKSLAPVILGGESAILLPPMSEGHISSIAELVLWGAAGVLGPVRFGVSK